MDKRTPDQVKFVTQKFFDDPVLEAAVAGYFSSSNVQERLTEGYLEYQAAIEEVKKDAPEGAKFLAEIDRKYAMTKETYEQETYETFKDMLAGILLPAAVLIPVKEELKVLLKNADDQNLRMLIESAIEDIFDYMIPRAINLVTLLSDGVPMPMAEKIVNSFGEAEIIPVEIKVCRDGDEENDDMDNCSEVNHECCGECGGRCDCKEKECCEETGHCQYEDGCNCGGNTDK